MAEQTQQATKEMCPFCKQLIQKNTKRAETPFPKMTRQELACFLYFAILVLGTAGGFALRIYQEIKKRHQNPQVVIEAKEKFQVPAAVSDCVQTR